MEIDARYSDPQHLTAKNWSWKHLCFCLGIDKGAVQNSWLTNFDLPSFWAWLWCTCATSINTFNPAWGDKGRAEYETFLNHRFVSAE